MDNMPVVIPSIEELEKELERTTYLGKFRSNLKSTIFALITVAAVAVLVATLLLPVLQIYGSSMSPTLSESDIVVSVTGNHLEQGDIIAFYYNNKILVKRAIAFAGDWVDLDDEGHVFVNGAQLEEPYVQSFAVGECDIELPYQVPEGRVFVMGDHRSTSQDSRTTAIGCVAEEQIVGEIVYKVWPLSEFGKVK